MNGSLVALSSTYYDAPHSKRGGSLPQTGRGSD